MSRLLFDCTRLVESGLHTGIQRVVRCLSAAAKRKLSDSNCDVLAVTFADDQWNAFDYLAPHPCQGLGIQPQPKSWPIMPGKDDILLLFDASWYAKPWPAVDAALNRGARLVGMVHDLLPMEHPEWFREGLEQRFSEHLYQLSQRAEHIFVPTETVRGRLLKRLRDQDNLLPINVLAHGGDFCTVTPTYEEIESFKNFLPGPATVDDPLYLVVGTLEPRKNHSIVLDAFDSLWAEGQKPRLLFVGNIGWQVDLLLKRLKEHPMLNKLLFHSSNLSDPALLWLIRNSTALIYLPKDEGFGLPVLEASMQACPVIASDISVLREAGKDWPCYINPSCIDGLIRAITSPSRTNNSKVNHRTWDDTALQLGSFLL